MTQHLTKSDFLEKIFNFEVKKEWEFQGERPCIIDFYADWCGPCKMMAPILEEIADEYTDKAKVCKLNTDDARDSAMEFGISAIPTLILFKDGQVQKKWVGLTSKKDIAAAINELL